MTMYGAPVSSVPTVASTRATCSLRSFNGCASLTQEPLDGLALPSAPEHEFSATGLVELDVGRGDTTPSATPRPW